MHVGMSTAVGSISDVADALGLLPDEYATYGRSAAKIELMAFDRRRDLADGRLICVTAVTPTKAGEGKTTTAISLVDALAAIGERPVLCLREPSLGPVFGIKGGGTGGGRAQLTPMESINLHFTGDIHAVGAANNLLAAMLDAHLFHGNRLGIDPLSITWKRCADVNDRALRRVVIGLGGRLNGHPRESGFDITAASEVMAVVAMATGVEDLRERLGAITVGTTFEGEAVTAEELGAAGSMAALLADAVKPNLVQTLEGRPALVHCGPFANIAHGNNSVLADQLALKLGDYVVTESGFGADMGFEKLVDIVCRNAGLAPSVAVVVATTQALKHHGGDPMGGIAAIERGAANLAAHIGIVRRFGVEAVVAVNRFPGDVPDEIEAIRRLALEFGSGGGRGQRRLRAGRRRGASGSRKRSSSAATAPARGRLPLLARRPDRGQDRRDCDAGLRRRRRWSCSRRRGAQRPAHRCGPGPAAGLHGQDAPLPLARSRADRRALGLHPSRPRAPALHRRGMDRRAVRRHADDARADCRAGRVQDRRRSRRDDHRSSLAGRVTAPVTRRA